MWDSNKTPLYDIRTMNSLIIYSSVFLGIVIGICATIVYIKIKERLYYRRYSKEIARAEELQCKANELYQSGLMFIGMNEWDTGREYIEESDRLIGEAQKILSKSTQKVCNDASARVNKKLRIANK